jgi:hypothetical protein
LLLKKITFRPLKNIDIASFASDLAQLPVINDPALTCEALLEQYNTGVQVRDKHAKMVSLSLVFALGLLGSMMRSLRREELADERKDDGDCLS